MKEEGRVIGKEKKRRGKGSRGRKERRKEGMIIEKGEVEMEKERQGTDEVGVG